MWQVPIATGARGHARFGDGPGTAPAGQASGPGRRADTRCYLQRKAASGPEQEFSGGRVSQRGNSPLSSSVAKYTIYAECLATRTMTSTRNDIRVCKTKTTLHSGRPSGRLSSGSQHLKQHDDSGTDEKRPEIVRTTPS